jgi:hypothetical protein
MLLDGYDHIVDINDNDGVPIAQVAKARGHHELAAFLDQLRDFEVRLANDSLIVYSKKYAMDAFSF